MLGALLASWMLSGPCACSPSAGRDAGCAIATVCAGDRLGMVMLTDEEDCSVPEHDIFYGNDPDYMGNPLNLRCHRFPEGLYPVERYVDGFLQLRTHPSRLAYATMAGVPADLAGATPAMVLADSAIDAIVAQLDAAMAGTCE